MDYCAESIDYWLKCKLNNGSNDSKKMRLYKSFAEITPGNPDGCHHFRREKCRFLEVWSPVWVYRLNHLFKRCFLHVNATYLSYSRHGLGVYDGIPHQSGSFWDNFGYFHY